MSSKLLKKIPEHGPVAVETQPAESSYVFPATFAQRRLWFLQELEPNQISYISTIARRLSGPLDVDAINFAINRIVERHDTMRTSFQAEAGEPVQVVSPYKRFEIAVEDLGDAHDPAAKAREIAVLEANTPFDLTASGLFRCRLLRLSTEEHVLLFTTHHIVFDGWSKNVWTRELGAFYREYISGEKARIGELEIQYGDFAAWQQEHQASKVLDDGLAFWVNALSGAPTLLTLPTDRPRSRGVSPDAGYVPFTMSKVLTSKLRKLAAETNSTLFMVTLTSFYIFLSRYSGVDDILLGTAIANRERLELEPLIGLFNNMLVMRGKVKPAASFRDNLEDVKRFTLDAYAHQDMPFEKLVEQLQPERNLTHNPLFQVMFSVHNTPREPANLPGIKVSAAASGRLKTKSDFSLAIVDAPEFLRGTIEYSAALFDQSTIERMLSHYLCLLEGIVSNVDLPVGELGLLSSGDVRQLVVEWNDTAVDYPRTRCVHELFSEQAVARRGSTAVLFGDERLSYGDLEERSNRLAHYLQAVGVARGQRVGVYLDRSLDLIVSLLAVMKAGAAYVPLDPSYPAKRVELILHDAEVACLITVSGLRHRLDHAGLSVLLDQQAGAIAEQPAASVVSGATADDLVYVTFTSGSTGRPKGVEIPHRALVNVVCSMAKELNMGPADVFPALASIGFDISAAELMIPLFTGGTLAISESHLAGNGEELAAFLSRHQATVVHATPTTWTLLLDAGFNAVGLKRCIGGEALPQALFERLMAAAPGTPLFNFYGPTETTVWSTVHRFTSVDETIVVGRPLANTQVYILDRNNQVCPIGVMGEIHIAGDGVARGYYGREDLTAERFVADPFSTASAARMYKTGDLGRWRVEGTIEHLGRVDHQVKIRGFRIELGEIETALTRLPGVREAVVITREDVSGDKRLVAYLTSASELDRGDLRAQLQQTLPDYMIPAAFVALDKLPLTPNGKVDRLNLPAPDAYATHDPKGQPPSTRMQVLLAEIWKDVLKVPTVNIEDDFFHLGGHSLLATQMVSRVWEVVGTRVPLVEIFEHTTLASFAAVVESAGANENAGGHILLSNVVRPARLPLSYGQQRLWFLDQLQPGSVFNNLAMKWRLHGVLNAVALQSALNEIAARHEVLRTTFGLEDGEPIQIISPAQPIELRQMDLTSSPEAEREEQAAILVGQESRRAFDLQSGPVFRAALLRMAEDDHVLVLNMHHIATDGWSLGLLRKELSVLYESFAAGRPSPLTPLPLQYADYAVWQRARMEAGAFDSSLEYWKESLRGAPPSIELPTDRPRPAMQTFRGATRSIVVPQSILASLKALSQKEGATLYMTALAAFNVLLSRYSGQEDIVIGTMIAGRMVTETEPLMGLFVNSLALRNDLSGQPGFREFLARVKATTVHAYAHQDLPFERLVEELNPPRDGSRSPLYQVMLILQNTPQYKVLMPGLEMTTFGTPKETSQMDLIMNLMEQPAGLNVGLTYNTDLFDQSTIKRMLSHYSCLLEGIVSNVDLPVGELGLLSSGDLQQLVVEWNDTAVDYPRTRCVHELFSEQAVARRDSTAVLFGDERLSYGELEDRSNRLAHYLQAVGVARGQRVGVYLDRSLDLILSLLAVMKAGAAYVPLDPSYPAKRVELILHDAEVACLITVSGLRHRLDHAGLSVLLDQQAGAIAEQPAASVVSGATADDLVYVTFTSGSTGRPKGVEIPHRALVNVVCSMAKELNMGPADVFPALASIGFDISAAELMIPLFTGGTLAISESHLAGNGEELAAFLSRHQATVVHATPTTWTLLLDAGFNAVGLKRCIGGEALPQALFERLMAAAPGTPLFNFYGPTETTVWSTVHRFTSVDETIVVGRPLANTQVYILDRNNQVCPIGVMGEIHIAGDGVARGYYGREDLTAERFVADPFSTASAARMYKTGDLGRWRVEGTIEHLGRVDHQVKIRGFRIELGEIETALTRLPGVREAVVITREDVSGDKRLVAYLTSASELDRGDLRAQLQQTLPDYMIPAAFVALDKLPLTPNGKVDRLNLPAPDAYATHDPKGQPPSTRMQVLLAEIWKDVLKVPTVNIEDDFFHLGGHSLLAAAMIGKLSESLGYRVRLAALFEAPTLGALADAAERQGLEYVQKTPIVPIRKTGTNPVLFCVSRPNVNALGFIFLARALSKNTPVYGLQTNMENDGSIAPFTQQEYEEKAAEYIAAMREVQPEGPYFLTGYCEGAHIAFEMARQLEAMNLEVGNIFILDVWPIENTIDQKRFILHSYGRVLRRFVKSSNRDRLNMISRKRRGLPATEDKNAKLARKLVRNYEPDRALRKALSKRQTARYWPGKDFELPIYNGNLVVFRVSKQPFYQIKDASLGWKARVRGNVSVITVPGTHNSILREPGVTVIASELERYIEDYLVSKRDLPSGTV